MSRNQNVLTKGDWANGNSPLNFEFYPEESVSSSEKQISASTKAKIGRLLSNAAFKTMQL